MTASAQIASARSRLNTMSPIQILSIHDAQAAHDEAEKRLSIAARRFHVVADAGQISLAVQIAEQFRKEFE